MGDIRIITGVDLTSFLITEAGENLTTEADEKLLRQLSTSKSFLVVTNGRPDFRTSDTDLPWVYGVKPGGILVQEDGDFLLQENGDQLFTEDPQTKSHLFRTVAQPRERTHG